MVGTTIHHYVFWLSVLMGLTLAAYMMSDGMRNGIAKIIRLLKNRTQIIGEECLVVRPVRPGVVGKVHLRKPWKGQVDWEVVSNHQIKIGNIAKVVGCANDKLIVERRVA